MCTHPNELAYTTRFGDVACGACHATVAWHPALVNPGVYGSRTQAWIDAQMRAVEPLSTR